MKLPSLQPIVRSRAVARGALVLAAALTAVALAETSLRLSGKALLAWRDRGIPSSQKPDGEIRVLCLGESTTMNQYPAFLEKILNDGGAEPKFTVIDQGVGGTNTGLILDGLPEQLDRFRPHVVVTMMGVNDENWSTPLDEDAPLGERARSWLRELRVTKASRLAFGEGAGPVPTEENPAPKAPVPPLKPEAEKAFQRGLMARGQGKLEEAGEWFAKSFAADPADGRAAVSLAELWRDRDSAVRERWLRKALETNPRNDAACVGMGQLRQNIPGMEEAEGWFRKALERNPENLEALIGLEIVHRERGNRPEADRWLRRLEETALRRNEGYYIVGETHRMRGDWAEAEKWYAVTAPSDSASRSAWLKARQIRAAGIRHYVAPYGRPLQYLPVTVRNYRSVRDMLISRGVKMVCVQYPGRSVDPLKKMVGSHPGVRFVDNESSFREALRKEGYAAYFWDNFAGDFGHCTEAGNRLLAENIAAVIRELYAFEPGRT